MSCRDELGEGVLSSSNDHIKQHHLLFSDIPLSAVLEIFPKSTMKVFLLSEGLTQDDSVFSEEEHAGLHMGAWVQISHLTSGF